MANITLGWNNRIDSGTLSGGSWQSTLPLTNLQARQVQRVARSTSAAASSTQFSIDLGQARSIGVLALVVHNISVTGYARITAGDTGMTNAMPNPRSPAGWGALDVTATNNNITGPDGQTSGVRLQATGTSAFISPGSVTATASTGEIIVFAKQGTSATAANLFTVSVNSTDTLRFTLNYSTGAIAYAVGSSGVVATSVGNGWWKLEIALSGLTVSDSVQFLMCFNGITGTPPAVGDFAYVLDPYITFGGSVLYDSGWGAVWPSGVVPQSLLEWEDDNFWLGTVSANVRAGYQSPYIKLLGSTQTHRYWRVEIADTSNSDGYVQIGRLFMSSTWTPSVNYAYGAGLGYQDPTPIDVSLSGAEYFDVRSKFRVFDFELQYILGTEAYANALELQRMSGTSGEVLCVPDSDDVSNSPARSFVGRLLQIGKISQPQPSAYNVAFQIKELL